MKMITPNIANPMPRKIAPTLGWYHSHASENAIIQSGMQTMRAAKNITKPTVPLSSPPTSGMNPNIVVMGEKNIHMPITIMKYATTRITHVIMFDLDTANYIISDLVIILSSTKSIYSIGFNS